MWIGFEDCRRRAKMEEESPAAQRRLHVVSRHLIPSSTPDSLFLHSNVLSASESATVDPKPVIVGGMVLDICAKPFTPVKPGTTTPGKILYRQGGVARNVSECMLKLGNKPFIISVVGLDMPAKLLMEPWLSSGLSTEGIQEYPGTETPVVSNIFDAQGELYAAVADAEAVEKFLNPDWIWKFRCQISTAPLVMVDANMSVHSLEAVCQIAVESGTPVWFEPVSVTKGKRILSIAKYITCTSPNQDELIAMANAFSSSSKFLPIERVPKDSTLEAMEALCRKLKPAICLLLQKGIKIIVVTLGKDGVLLCSKEGPALLRNTMRTIVDSSFGRDLYEFVSASCHSHQFVCSTKSNYGSSNPYIMHYPALPASVVSLTGAGDCLVGGALSSLCAGLDIIQSVAVGMAVAKAAVETDYNVPTHLSLKKVADDAKQIFAAAREVMYD